MKLKHMYNQYIREAKQVGTVYHFTGLAQALDILKTDHLRAGEKDKLTMDPDAEEDFFSDEFMDEPIDVLPTDLSKIIKRGELFTEKADVQTWLRYINLEDFELHEDLSVSTSEMLIISDSTIKRLPVKFKSTGTLTLICKKLETLEGIPEHVKGSFYCQAGKMKTLENGPNKVDGHYWCQRLKLESLLGAAEIIPGNFLCVGNNLKTLVGGPKEVQGDFRCNSNKLETLQGAPTTVSGDFICTNNGKKFTIQDVQAVTDVKGAILT